MLSLGGRTTRVGTGSQSRLGGGSVRLLPLRIVVFELAVLGRHGHTERDVLVCDTREVMSGGCSVKVQVLSLCVVLSSIAWPFDVDGNCPWRAAWLPYQLHARALLAVVEVLDTLIWS